LSVNDLPFTVPQGMLHLPSAFQGLSVPGKALL
jgi:hypothetical protein